MVIILEKSEHNVDFYPMVDFIEASPLRYALTVKPTVYVSHIRQFWSTARIETTKEGIQILATVDGIHRTVTESSLRRNLKLQDEEGISYLLDTTYNFSKMIFDGLVKNVNNKVSKFLMHPRARIAQSSALSTVADEPESPLRDISQGEACHTDSGFIADQDRATIAKSSALPYDLAPRVTSPATTEGREAAAERASDDTEEIATVLTSMDAATVASGAAEVPTGSGSIPTVGHPAIEVPTSSDVVPTASPVFSTTTVAKELEEKLEREDQRRSEQIARDAEIARIHAEEELQIMIDGLDRNNETVVKYLQEYHQFASELPIERRIELISDLVKYQDNYAKIYKLQSQKRKPLTKKQKRDYYMAVIRSNLGWKMEDFIPMGSKEEAERIKRKGLSLEQESTKKQKTTEEVTEEAKSSDEVSEEKVKEMMQLVPIEEVYVESLQVKHPIID
nr:xylulose kinase-1 [Tanacetum cinerariifolium]